MACIKALKKFQVRVAGCHKFLPPRKEEINFARGKHFCSFRSTIVWHSLHYERLFFDCCWHFQIPAPSADKRELKQRWRRGQRERQKSNRFSFFGKTQLYTCITLFCTFLWIIAVEYTTTTWKCIILRGGRKHKTTKRLSFSFPELWLSLLEFKSRKKNCQHLMNWMRWNKRDKVCDFTF